MPAFLEKLIISFYFIKFRYFMKFSSRQNLIQWQQKVSRKFFKKVKNNSTYYRQLWTNEDFKNYPIIDKASMMENFNILNTANLDRDECLKLAIASEKSRNFNATKAGITVGLSSGTSGHRGMFVVSPFERAKYAGTILAKALPKGRIFKKTKVALFLRANSNLYKTVKSNLISFKFYDILKDLDLSKEDLETYQPDLLIAQPSVLRYLAEKKKKSELNIKPYRIFSAAEVLEPKDRIFIEESFGQVLHQIYQCTEGFLGITCELGTLHLNEDLMIIEKERINNHPHKFQPIISDFNRYTQPVIKYRLNDILTEAESPCPCGSNLLTIKSIDGRSDDSIYFLSSMNGNWQIIWPDLIRNHILYSNSNIQEYNVTQNIKCGLEISIKSSGDIEQVKSDILNELLNLSKKMECLLPEITFKDFTENKDFSSKLRRIKSEFKPIGIGTR